MTTERDLDRTLDRWMDDGPTIVADRVIAAAMTDVHTTRQRGARWALLKEPFMTMRPAATMAALAVVAVLGIAVYQIVPGGQVGIGEPLDRVLTSDDLPDIVVTADNNPDGLIVDATDSGVTALVTPMSPGGASVDQTAFVDAMMTNINTTDTGGYVSWAALFETNADGEAAFDFLVDEHGQAGWGMQRSTSDPGLGDESASFTGAAYDIFERNRVYLWRVDNLVLAAVGVGDFDEDQVRAIADLMDDRAQ